MREGEMVRTARFLRLNVIPVLVVGGLALAGCSSSGSSSSSSSAAQSGATSSGSSGSANIAALQADVAKAAATPSFSDYQGQYGGKIPSIANLAGKKIMIIPGVSALAACEEIAQAASNIAKASGMVPTIFNN